MPDQYNTPEVIDRFVAYVLSKVPRLFRWLNPMLDPVLRAIADCVRIDGIPPEPPGGGG